MRDLVADGWSAQAGRGSCPVPGRCRPAVADAPTRLTRCSSVAAPVDAAVGRRSTGGPIDLGPADAAELLSAAADLSPARLAAILDDRFSRGSFETVVDEWLMPAMVAVGDAWAAGTLSTAAEHLTAHAVLRRLSAAFEAAAHGGRGPSVLVGLPPGCRHELGALAFATAARRAGLSVTYVGADLPVESWLDAVAHGRPRADRARGAPTPGRRRPRPR